jgi:cellobiose epimerase
LHVLEALSPYVATLDRTAADRLLELLLLLAVTMGRTPERPGHGRFQADWRPAPGYVMRQYGHDVELLWMVEEAWMVLGLPPAGLAPLLRDTLDDVLRFGYDHRRGGIFWSGFAGRTAHKTEREFWSQAEGLLAALRLYRRTGDPRYGRCYLGTLGWIVRHQADWEHGDWHQWVDDRGRGTGDKSGEWKDPYHQGRALIECLELLRPT